MSLECKAHPFWSAVQKVNSALWSVKCREWSAELPATNMATPKETHRIKTKQGGTKTKISCETSNIVVCQKVSREPH